MSLVARIDACLPQTQCGKCGHPGCRPYAVAIAAGEPINRCPPGGAETIAALATLLDRPTLALDTTCGEARPVVASIREAECIGCTLCIQACPVDAILGAAKLMHTVLTNECTGCELCVAPCPVDCIDLLPLPVGQVYLGDDGQQAPGTGHLRERRREVARQRFEHRQVRLQRDENRRYAERAARSAPTATPAAPQPAAPGPALGAIERLRQQRSSQNDPHIKQAKAAVSMRRAQLNRSLNAFATPPTAEHHSLLATLYQECQWAEQRLQQLQASPSHPPSPQP